MTCPTCWNASQWDADAERGSMLLGYEFDHDVYRRVWD